MADFPNIGFTSMNFISNHPTVVTRSISGAETRHQSERQFYSFTADFLNITDAERRQLLGFLATKKGSLNTFTIDLPGAFQDSSGTFTGTVTAVGISGQPTASAAGSSLVGVTFTDTVTRTILKAGDLIKFANHAKVYMVTSDLASTGGATAQTKTFTVYPELRTAVSSQVITYNNVPMTVRCSTDAISFTTDPTYYSSFSLDFIEVA